MKKATCLLLSLLIFATFIFAEELENPCKDELYLELKKKTLSEMTDREYQYFITKDTACEEWKLSVKIEQEQPKSTLETIGLYIVSPIVSGIVFLGFFILVFT